MNKKIVFLLALSLCFTFEIFSQQKQKLTFTDLREDGSIIGTVTVNAVFFSWNQQRISIENGLLVTRERVYLAEWGKDGVWSDWELMAKQPSQGYSISRFFYAAQDLYIKHPRGVMRMYFNGYQAIRLMTIPNGYTSPIWWGEDGNSFYAFYKSYVIIP